jgi:putative redox protein
MVKIDISYQGQLHCEAVHGPSGAKLATDAPKDNHGKGEAFSPTDLVATALGTCMLTVMGIVAQRHNISLEGVTASVVKEMAASPARRIGKLTVQINVPGNLDQEQRKLLENAAHTCPVHKSLHPEIDIPLTFHWGA